MFNIGMKFSFVNYAKAEFLFRFLFVALNLPIVVVQL